MRIWVYLGITALGLRFWAAASQAAFAAEPALWSLRKPARPELPPVKDERWQRNPIDRFILAALEAAGLFPSPEADRRTLIRRLSLDLTGLPPSPAGVEAFIADPDPATCNDPSKIFGHCQGKNNSGGFARVAERGKQDISGGICSRMQDFFTVLGALSPLPSKFVPHRDRRFSRH